MVRLFTAILFDDATKTALAGAAESLRLAGVLGNFSRRENFHLTLVFLGEQPEDRIPAIRHAMDEAALKAAPFDLSIGGIGSFRGGIVWAGVSPSPALGSLWKDLCEALRRKGFRFRDENYSPHLTLCREAGWQGKLPEVPLSGRVPVKQIALMKSWRQGGLLTYTPLYQAEFGVSKK
jgi:2'-5' RNA ligase